jgi:hypothetical protein
LPEDDQPEYEGEELASWSSGRREGLPLLRHWRCLLNMMTMKKV